MSAHTELNHLLSIPGAAATGEIASVTADTITIEGSFPPGLSVELRPGRRVLVSIVDEVLGL